MYFLVFKLVKERINYWSVREPWLVEEYSSSGHSSSDVHCATDDHSKFSSLFKNCCTVVSFFVIVLVTMRNSASKFFFYWQRYNYQYTSNVNIINVRRYLVFRKQSASHGQRYSCNKILE